MKKCILFIVALISSNFGYSQTFQGDITTEQAIFTAKQNNMLISAGEVRYDNIAAYTLNNRSNLYPGLIETFQFSPLIGAYMMNDEVGFYDNTSTETYLRNGQLLFTEGVSPLINRMNLNEDGLTFVNGGQWTSARLFNSTGSSGALELYAGGGTGLNVEAGPDLGTPSRGHIYVFDQGANKVELRSFSSAGIININGSNGSDNAFVSWPGGRPDVGYIAAEDVNGQIQAGLIVNSNGDGEVFGDTKNFRMEHPKQPGKEIWYASIEGPEAAAYERGTATLQGGEAFVPFSEHFELVLNPETMTVILTPHSADTYGLAVIEKTAKGIRVKELKGGRGNFGFDWEVKGVRKGYEEYRVIRDASEMIPGHEVGEKTALQENPTSELPIVSETPEEMQAETTAFSLEQNQPNPFNEATVIRYTLPATTKTAELRIFDINGKLVQTYTLSPDDGGVLDISGNTFTPGIYNYSLFVDGHLKKSRKMVMSK